MNIKQVTLDVGYHPDSIVMKWVLRCGHIKLIDKVLLDYMDSKFGADSHLFYSLKDILR